jgi:hypothetical protein
MGRCDPLVAERVRLATHVVKGIVLRRASPSLVTPQNEHRAGDERRGGSCLRRTTARGAVTDEFLR